MTTESEQPDIAMDNSGEPTGSAEPMDADPMAVALAEIEKWRDLALRSQADLENYRKRMAREKSDAILYANVSLLSSLLPVLDNFEMGLQAAKQDGENNIIYQGFLMVRKQIEDFLADQGVKAVPVAGPFDPNQHEAVQEVHSDSVPVGEIVDELRRGYRLNDRLLRAANVTVSKGPANA
ncbi:MAG: nucleotide exchange factor GrpE [Verrucomicrobiae bacterium]|nr:nucleotide exchange factor GrpE [Verrucomicrobiae bacterium]MCB1086384.1 nucleotide exchange factor GrpE [Verrucomicrobiae bacterium]MCB1091767.1 nucleotide exchange factor GrpE [Verrucomicrobiae bacterium]